MDRRNHVSGQTGVTGSNPVLTTKIKNYVLKTKIRYY